MSNQKLMFFEFRLYSEANFTQRQGARRLPGTQFISLIPKMILKQLFFYTFNWQMWRMPERAISERSVQPMLCGERSRGL